MFSIFFFNDAKDMVLVLFEEIGGTYTQDGDYFLPDLKLPEKETQPIGIWGRRHLRYLEEYP